MTFNWGLSDNALSILAGLSGSPSKIVAIKQIVVFDMYFRFLFLDVSEIVSLLKTNIFYLH